MTLRQRPRFARAALTRVAIGAAASLAVVASTGVTAGAVEDVTIDDPDATSQTPTETAEPTEPTEPAVETPTEDTEAPVLEEPLAEDPATTAPPALSAPAPQNAAAAEAPVVALAPNYGTQKVRVGVQLADGSYVPEGTTLVGSTVRITITGGVDGDQEPLPDESFECTTIAGFLDDDGSRSSSCDLDGPFGFYDLGAGRTLTVQHLSSPDGIELNPVPLVVEPCETAGPAGSPCGGDNPFESAVDALVEVTGTKPTARDDAATTPFNTAIVIDVLANDDSGNGAPITGLSIAEQPANGTAEVVGELPPVVEPEPPVDPEEPVELAEAPEVAAAPVAAAPSPVQVRYTPNAGFVGTDTFVYAVTTPNGTAFATVTVQVLGVAAPTAVTPARTGVLPNVGGSDATLVGLGALLVTAGGATLAAGRRRAEVRDLLA